MTEPVAKRADQLVVGDRIPAEKLPAAASEPGVVRDAEVYEYLGKSWVYVSYRLPNGLIEATHYLPEAELQIFPADPTGLTYTRADDGEQPQPTAGRVPPHFESGRVTETFSDRPKVLFEHEERQSVACPAHGVHPHLAANSEPMVCLDCPECRPPGSTV